MLRNCLIENQSNMINKNINNESTNKKKLTINMTWRMLVKRFFFLFLPLVLIILVGVNYFVDAENLYYQQYERIMARYVVKGNNITNISKYDDRMYQKYAIAEMRECPDIIVVGSTRTMMINKYYFGNYTFFNNSMNGTTIEDIITLIMLYDKKNCLPENIIIGIDPWLLNKNNYQERWKSLSFEFNDALERLGIESVEIEKKYIHQRPNKLFSLHYFFDSIHKTAKQAKKPLITKRNFNQATTKLEDGSIIYSKSFRERSLEEINQNVVITLKKRSAYGFEGNGNFNEKNQMAFETLINYLINNGINVIFYFSPYHPMAYKTFSGNPKYKNFINSEIYFKNLAKENRIQCIGSFNPYKLGMDESYFLDYQNSNYKCVNELVAKIEF